MGGLGIPAHSEEHVPSPNPGRGEANLADTDRGGVDRGPPLGPIPPKASKQARETAQTSECSAKTGDNRPDGHAASQGTRSRTVEPILSK